MAEKISGQESKNRKRRIKHPMRLAVFIWAAVVIILIGVVYFFPWVNDRMADTMTIEYGTLDNQQDCKVYFVKNEMVYFADKSGKVGYSYGEGDMIRTGSTAVSISSSSDKNKTNYSAFEDNVSDFLQGNTLLKTLTKSEKNDINKSLDASKSADESAAEQLEIQNAAGDVARNSSSSSDSDDSGSSSVKPSTTGITGNYKAEKSGIISYKLDGYESALSPYTMQYLDKSKVSSISNKSSDVFTGLTTKGKPLYKIVDSREWYAVTWVNSDYASRFSEGNTVTLKLDSGDASGSVEKVMQQDSEYLIIMKFDSYFSGIAPARSESCRIVTSDERGLIVKNDFITEKDGQPGVYVLDVTGETKFTPVKILASDGEYSLAASGSFTDGDGNTVNTINVYDEIKKVN